MIAAAVGIAVTGKPGGRNNGLSEAIRHAMAMAVLAAQQEGVDNPKLIRRRMRAARQRVVANWKEPDARH